MNYIDVYYINVCCIYICILMVDGLTLSKTEVHLISCELWIVSILDITR